MNMQNQPTVTILFTSGSGEHWRTPIQVPAGTTIGDFFRRQNPSSRPDAYTIRYNRDRVSISDPSTGTPGRPTMTTVIADQSQISFTPNKIEGAAA